ncbi:MAG: tetratricopeptide repeat protein [Isosphaeraceae bacterium]
MVPLPQSRFLLLTLPMLFLTGVLLESGCRRPAADVAPPGNPPAAPTAQTLASDGTVKALAEFNQGAALLEQYKYARAAEKFEVVVAAFPAWTAARFNLGLALLNLPDAPDALDRAEAEFRGVVALEPDHRWAHFCLGVLYEHKGDFDKALDHFGKVIGSDPDDPFVGFEYAETLRKLNRNPEALQVLEKDVEHDPGFVSAFYSLGMLYNRMRQRDKAVQILKRFGELKPQELAVGSYGVVEPYAGKGKFTQAPAQPEAGGEHLTTCARLADLDSDGDLDLLAMRIKAGSATAWGQTEFHATARGQTEFQVNLKLGLTPPLSV